jgi:hypothetical protein
MLGYFANNLMHKFLPFAINMDTDQIPIDYFKYDNSL